MNSFEINKYLGALLGTCLVLMAIHLASGAIFYSPAPAKPGYEVAVKEEKAGHGDAAKPAEVPIETLLASASVEHGAQVAKQCGACHNFQEGQGPKVGPDLYGVVGRQIASKPGFNYSAALKAKSGTWSFRRARQVAQGSARRRARHRHDLCRPFERKAARRCDRVSQFAVEEPAAAAHRAEGRRVGKEVAGAVPNITVRQPPCSVCVNAAAFSSARTRM